MARKKVTSGGHKRARFTDGSGVLITSGQYRELHGEQSTLRRRTWGAELHEEKPSNIFAKVADMAETGSAYEEVTHSIKVVQCGYCQVDVRWDGIGPHTRKAHRTNDLRFKPAGEKVISFMKKKRKKNAGNESYGSALEKEETSKGADYYRREGNGQFGSYPLHDDHNE